MKQLKFPEDDGYEEEDGAEGGPASKEAGRNVSTITPRDPTMWIELIEARLRAFPACFAPARRRQRVSDGVKISPRAHAYELSPPSLTHATMTNNNH